MAFFAKIERAVFLLHSVETGIAICYSKILKDAGILELENGNFL